MQSFFVLTPLFARSLISRRPILDDLLEEKRRLLAVYIKSRQTELLVISSKYRFTSNLDFVQVVVERIEPKSTVRNLGVVMDQFFKADHHITAICKTSKYHPRNIARIRKYLDEASTETLVHAIVSSKLDHCNGLIHRLPKY